jgi:hypothetical protein
MAQGLQLGGEELRRLWIAGGNLQMREGGRRERKCSRRKKMILYRGAVKRRTVG